MRRITYGLGGFDPTKPNNNLVEEFDDGIEDQPDPNYIPPEEETNGTE